MRLSNIDTRAANRAHGFQDRFVTPAIVGLVSALLTATVASRASARTANSALQTDSKNWELTTKRSVPELVKMLQLGSSAQKSQAAQALGDKAYTGDATTKDAIPALLQVMRCMTGGKAAEDAAVALAKIGAPAAELLRDELTGASKQSNSSSKILAARALGLMGPEVKGLAEPALLAILDNPRRNFKVRDPLTTEAACALASMGGPFKPGLVPDIIAAMNVCKNQDTQLAIAFQLVDMPDVRDRYLADLGPVFVRASENASLTLSRRQEILDALVKINTPAALQAVLLALAPPQKNLSPNERETAALALAKIKSPSHQVLDAMARTLPAERSPMVLRAIYRAFAAFGQAANPAIPHLESHLKDLPERKNLDGGDKEKPGLAQCVQKTIEAIKTSVTNPAPGPKPAEAMALGPKDAAVEKGFQDLNAQVVIALEIINKPGGQGQRVAYLEAVLVKGLSDPAVAPELRPDILQGLARIKSATAVRAVCDVLASPKKSSDCNLRATAAKALAEAAPPSPQVIDTLVTTLKTDHSATVLTAVCKTLCAFGPAAEPALQPLKDYLRDLPDKADLDGGEREKPWLATVLKESVSTIRQAVAEDVLNGAAPASK